MSMVNAQSRQRKSWKKIPSPDSYFFTGRKLLPKKTTANKTPMYPVTAKPNACDKCQIKVVE